MNNISSCTPFWLEQKLNHQKGIPCSEEETIEKMREGTLMLVQERTRCLGNITNSRLSQNAVMWQYCFRVQAMPGHILQNWSEEDSSNSGQKTLLHANYGRLPSHYFYLSRTHQNWDQIDDFCLWSDQQCWWKPWLIFGLLTHLNTFHHLWIWAKNFVSCHTVE